VDKRDQKIKSTIDGLRTQARKLNVEFSDATAQHVKWYLERQEGPLPKIELNKYGTVIRKLEK
jgi:hypothetical protein